MNIKCGSKPQIHMEQLHFCSNDVTADLAQRHVPALSQGCADGNSGTVPVVDLLALGRAASELYQQLGNGSEKVLHTGR